MSEVLRSTPPGSLWDVPEALAQAVLSGAMGTAHPECDRALTALAHHTLGLAKSDAKFKRKSERLVEALGDHVVKGAAYRHEIARLEKVLVWIYRTEHSIKAIREVIGRTIPRRLQSSIVDKSEDL